MNGLNDKKIDQRRQGENRKKRDPFGQKQAKIDALK